MAKKIGTVWNQSSTKASDPTKNIKLAAEDTDGTPISPNMDQLSSMVSYWLGLQSNHGTPTYFSMTIPNDTYNAVIAPLTGYTYDSYMILVDDSSTPNSNTAGWISGPVPTRYTVADNDSHNYYLHLLNSTTVTSVGTADGLGYIRLKANQSATTGISTVSLIAYKTTDSIDTVLANGYLDTYNGILRTGDVLVVRKVDADTDLTENNYLLRVVYSGDTVALERIALDSIALLIG